MEIYLIGEDWNVDEVFAESNVVHQLKKKKSLRVQTTFTEFIKTQSQE